MNILFQTAVIIFIYMVIAFLVALLKKDNSVVDIFWGPGFILVSIYSLLNGGDIDLHKLLMNFLVLLWGLRLGFYVYFRNRGRGEDFRYKSWRETWKYFALRSFFQIFMLQGLFMLIISLPIYYVNFSSAISIDIYDYIGIVIFIIGFFFETMGDYQLARFKKDPENKGKLITAGLWKITRHPNYFGEALIWWGLALFALNYPGGWKTLISPIMITWLLRFVSGVPMLEKKYAGRPDWEEYRKKTAPFVPFIKFL